MRYMTRHITRKRMSAPLEAQPAGSSAAVPSVERRSDRDYYQELHDTSRDYQQNNWLVEKPPVLRIGVDDVGCLFDPTYLVVVRPDVIRERQHCLSGWDRIALVRSRRRTRSRPIPPLQVE
jgi:hypothetical protein